MFELHWISISRDTSRSLHGKSLISLVITVRHRMEYVFTIILYRMIISSASPRNRIVDRLYHGALGISGMYLLRYDRSLNSSLSSNCFDVEFDVAIFNSTPAVITNYFFVCEFFENSFTYMCN